MTDRRRATLGVLLGIFLAAVDGTIVSTAMPTVVGSLGGLQYYSWAFAAYMLFAAVSMPLYGRLADIYGRKKLFYVGVALFVVGSVLCGLARDMLQLVAFRSLQGLGAGAMFAIPYTILGVVYPPEKRGKAIGLGSSVWGISSVIGPLLGFAIVETLGWRWVFLLGVPIGLAAVALVATSLSESTGSADPDVDYLGAATLVLGVGAVLVGLQTLESRPETAVGLVAGGAVVLAGFYVVERRASQPLVPLSLFRDRTFGSTNAVAFLSSFALFAAITYVPLYVQSVGSGAGSAALAVFPISIGWSGTSFVSGQVVARVGERRLVRVGTGVLVVSFAVAAVGWSTTTPLWLLLGNVFVMGVGMGALTPPLLTAIQNHLGTEQMGLATSSQQFFRNLGGTAGVAVLGFAMNLTLRDRLTAVPGVDSIGDLQRLLLGTGSPPAELGAVMMEGLQTVFLASLGVCLLAALAAAAVPAPGAAGPSPFAGDEDDPAATDRPKAGDDD
jgi:EmrB/QacA subfamily drug resistance transporter